MELEGLFWKPAPPKKAAEKSTPPEPVWLSPDYLPGLEEAQRFNVPMMDWQEMERAQLAKEELICDIECYGNYFLAAFTSFATGRCFYVEAVGGESRLSSVERDQLEWFLRNFPIVTFNGNSYDLPILALALDGKTCQELKFATNMLIRDEMKPWQVLKSFKTEPLEINHVDLIEVCPLDGSLKIYGGRLHVPKMQDLPFHPESELSPEQIAIMRFYCINDLTTTAFLRANLSEQLRIREEMSTKYDVDLRSKSDAQIAEAVIKSEIERLGGFTPKRPEIPAGTCYFYRIPEFVKFQTPAFQNMLEMIRKARFVVSETGSIEKPPELEDFKLQMGNIIYTMGIGGLHSTESCVAHRSNGEFTIVDRDIASNYPIIILNQALCPVHLGFDFLNVYRSLVERRLAAKRAGDKLLADMLKIVINGSFGKFGSKWSALYAPDLMIQVTLTGQLALLMMIESLELAGVEVCSANTDGVVFKFPRVMEETVARVISEWERATAFETEETRYDALFSRDVNNYIAIKPGGEVKTKGAYANPWNDPKSGIFRFHKNPTNSICIEAVCEWLTKGTPVAETIWSCRKLPKFLTVRTVKGGAVKDGVFLGKAIRWYYATGAGGCIVYAQSGNKVPKSDGARPCMNLPEAFPDDLDFARYEAEAVEILREIAAI